MNSTAQIGPPRTPNGHEQPTAAERPTFGATPAEIVPLIGFVPVAGPPAVFVLGPWLFLVLMLAAPFAVLVTLVAVMVAAATVVAALAAAPYLLVRHYRHRAPRTSISAPIRAIESPRVAT
jgi:hypothetical protein